MVHVRRADMTLVLGHAIQWRCRDMEGTAQIEQLDNSTHLSRSSSGVSKIAVAGLGFASAAAAARPGFARLPNISGLSSSCANNPRVIAEHTV